MSLPKFFIIFLLMMLNFKISEATLTIEELKVIKLKLRQQIVLHEQNENVLIEMGQMLKDRQFEPTDLARHLTESQTIGLACICYQKAFILNSHHFENAFIMGALFEKWALLTKITKKDRILEKYKAAFQNYMLYYFSSFNDIALSKIANVVQQFYDVLHAEYFESSKDCLIWIYSILFDSKIIDFEKLKLKVQNIKKEEILWQFLMKLEKKSGQQIQKMFSNINK